MQGILPTNHSCSKWLQWCLFDCQHLLTLPENQVWNFYSSTIAVLVCTWHHHYPKNFKWPLLSPTRLSLLSFESLGIHYYKPRIPLSKNSESSQENSLCLTFIHISLNTLQVPLPYKPYFYILAKKVSSLLVSLHQYTAIIDFDKNGSEYRIRHIDWIVVFCLASKYNHMAICRCKWRENNY